MTTHLAGILAIVICAYSVLAIVDSAVNRSLRRFFVYLIGGTLSIAILYLTTGFPFPARVPFGETGISPLLAIGLMFVCVLLGIAATYVFNLTDSFAWGDFARPLVVSPLILLPLIGSVQSADITAIQLICYLILAFQNGFFWQQVLKDAKPKTS